MGLIQTVRCLRFTGSRLALSALAVSQCLINDKSGKLDYFLFARHPILTLMMRTHFRTL